MTQRHGNAHSIARLIASELRSGNRLKTEVKLTRPQRDFLVLAAEQPDGNPWPKMPMVGGGASMRMAERLTDMGLMTSHNQINDAGRAAVAKEVKRRADLRSGALKL